MMHMMPVEKAPEKETPAEEKPKVRVSMDDERLGKMMKMAMASILISQETNDEKQAGKARAQYQELQTEYMQRQEDRGVPIEERNEFNPGFKTREEAKNYLLEFRQWDYKDKAEQEAQKAGALEHSRNQEEVPLTPAEGLELEKLRKILQIHPEEKEEEMEEYQEAA